MKKTLNLLAFDVGNSAIRVMLCRFDGETVSSEAVLTEPNEAIDVGGLLYWDMLHIFSVLKRGLAAAAKKVDAVDSVGVCTWGVDFALLDGNDHFLGHPLCYRNAIGAEELSRQSDAQRRSMFFDTGILSDQINTVYLLRGMGRRMPAILNAAEKLLMVPDALVYLFTGEKWNEPTELSTTQMLNVRDLTLSPAQCAYAGVRPGLFAPIPRHGQRLGFVRKSILEELGIGYDIPFLCVPSHDTACAVMAIPTQEEEYLFVSSGTWALVGAQCPAPVITQRVLDAGLTNEQGAFGRTTLLRNSAGMFLTQRLKAEYEAQTGRSVGWDEFTALSGAFGGEPRVFDVNDPRLFNPKSMAREIERALSLAPSAQPRAWPEILASAYASLGDSYVANLATVMECTGKTYSEVYIVGGGAKNAVINQRCADRIGLPVITCAAECASIGNAVAQIAYFRPELGYAGLRRLVANSLPTRVFQPR